ncbi:DUF6477 family protein [Actibacterium pelagium]|uniref:Uncharacterized protein n=1 Tax=Actibacterium pelagium TaxID=2029103 RepID=A0A917AC83_9RHOB|nr:DUF6477 family protein [Actibacterium pelagium]GGE42070.1 hypothetical protein GCM10011517_07110 [Actibacterium pelagium]
MSDLNSLLSSLRRPRLLIRAARIGLSDYRRDRDLGRILQEEGQTTAHLALDALITAEAEIESIRKAGDVTYSARRHVEILIALMAELKLLPQAPAQSC